MFVFYVHCNERLKMPARRGSMYLIVLTYYHVK